MCDSSKIREAAVECRQRLVCQLDKFGDAPERWRIESARDIVDRIVSKLDGNQVFTKSTASWVLGSMRSIFYGWSDASQTFTASVDADVSRLLIALYDLVQAQSVGLPEDDGGTKVQVGR